MGFLGWAWVRSMSLHDGFIWAGTRQTLFWGQGMGEVRIDIVGGGGLFLGPSVDPFSWKTSPGNGSDLLGKSPKGFSKWFPHYSTPTEIDIGGGYSGRGLVVAHWFLILLFLIPWVSFLAWRVRRQRKQTNA